MIKYKDKINNRESHWYASSLWCSSICLSVWLDLVWFHFIQFASAEHFLNLLEKKNHLPRSNTPLSVNERCRERIPYFFIIGKILNLCKHKKFISPVNLWTLSGLCFFFWKLSKACFAHVPLLDIYLVVLTDRRTIQRYEISNFKFWFNLKKKPSHFKNFINDLSDMLWYMKMYGVVLIVNPFNPKST